MPYKYEPSKPNPYRKKAGYKYAGWVAPGEWKANLGSAYDPLAEDLYNRGIVADIQDFKEKIASEGGREELVKKASEQDKTFGQRLKEGLSKIFVDPVKKGAEYVQEAFAEDPKLKDLREQQTEFIRDLLGVARQGIPQEIERTKQQLETPYLEQAFGQVGGPVAGALGGTLLSQLAQSPGSEFTSGEFQSTNPLSGQLLGSLLSSLAVQGASKYGPQLYEQYGPQASELLGQGLGYAQQGGQSALDLLRRLAPQ